MIFTKTRIIGLILIVVITLAYQIFPVIQSESKIRSNMLRKFPIGTSKQIIWEYVKKYYERSPDDVYDEKTGWRRNYYKDPLIGSSHIRAEVVQIPPFCVSVIWIFDEKDKLIEVTAWRTIDLW